MEVQPQEEPIGEHEALGRHRLSVAKEDGLLFMRRPDLVVGQPGAADGQAQLVQGEVLAHPHGEGEGHDLEVEGPLVARCNLVEPVTVIGDHPGEDVDAAGGALRIGLAPEAGREIEPLLELDQVRAPGLEHGAVAPQVDLVEDVVLELALHRVVTRQETAPDAQGPLPEAQVQAGRLHVGVRNVESPGVDVAGPDGPLEQVAREDAFGAGGKAQHHASRRSDEVIHGHAMSKARGGAARKSARPRNSGAACG